MTKEERAKIVFEETHKVLGDEMASLALIALAFTMLTSDTAKEKANRIREACTARGVKVDE